MRIVRTWPLTMSTRSSASLRKPCWHLHLRDGQGRVGHAHGPDLLPLRAAAHRRELREDRVPPAGVGRDEEPHVDLEDVLGGVREPLDDLAHLLEDLGAVVGPELRLAGAQDGDLLAVPVGGSRPAEDPLDDGFLGVLLALGDPRVAGDVVAAPLEAGLVGEAGRGVVGRFALVALIAIVGVASGSLPAGRSQALPAAGGVGGRRGRVWAQRPSGASPPSNIVSIMAVRRFMPGASLPVWPGFLAACKTSSPSAPEI